MKHLLEETLILTVPFSFKSETSRENSGKMMIHQLYRHYKCNSLSPPMWDLTISVILSIMSAIRQQSVKGYQPDFASSTKRIVTE